MIQPLSANRRRVLAGIATLAAGSPTATLARSVLDAATFGVVADTGTDQTDAVQQALDAAAAAGQTVCLPGGTILVRNLVLPGNLIVQGVPGNTELTSDSGPVATIAGRTSLVLRDLIFTGLGTTDGTPALLAIESSDSITLERCTFRNAPATAIALNDAAATIGECSFADIGDAAIHSMDSRGLLISGNRIAHCGNAGIRIWRSESGADGSIITANRISNIDWRGGGNGQNGNGINVFKADEVIIADNHISDCAFSSVRLNSTNNTQVSGNTCLRSREVAIFSEFAFSGSVIANNIVDDAAFGISMTNLDQGGQLAVCSGNIVRNITPVSPVNPDTSPVGISAEANAAISGNTVQNVPGIGINAGYGPYLRNVLIASNVISDSNIGIAVSVAPDAGPVHIANNTIYRPLDYAIVGKAWDDLVEPDLLANAGRYPHVTFG